MPKRPRGRRGACSDLLRGAFARFSRVLAELEGIQIFDSSRPISGPARFKGCYFNLVDANSM
jgi:hypothetical protein